MSRGAASWSAIMYKMFGCFADADRGGCAIVGSVVLGADVDGGIEFRSGAMVVVGVVGVAVCVFACACAQ